MSTDPSRLIAALARDQVSLDLKTVDLCFLAGLYLRADRAALASFEEDALVDMFEQVCDVVDPGADRPRTRATHAIQRLRDQRMLARVDGAGIVRSGEYALTRLAAAVIGYLIDDEKLTRESLTLLTGTLRVQLAEVLAAAKRADSEQSWRTSVVAPLRVTVGDLVGGIERRQRGLDSQQEQVQAEIAALLQADWFGAVERCQALLDTTTDTLRELNEVLLRDTHHLLALLQEIQALATDAAQPEPEQAVQRVIEHVDRIGAWGGARQRAWSEYYQYVHRYLRDVVRLDPDRALSQRLRDQTAGWASTPFHLLVSAAPSIRLLRPLESRVERPPVTRARTDRERAPDLVEPEDTGLTIRTLVAESLAAGASSLVEVTVQVLSRFPEHLHYAITGRVADELARVTRARSAFERPWRPVDPGLEVEDWELAARGATR
ncbi:MAG: condensin subunit MukF [Myxococcales bacterium]|nr:condensin subunit MukF [Myxococcales bacterium]